MWPSGDTKGQSVTQFMTIDAFSNGFFYCFEQDFKPTTVLEGRKIIFFYFRMVWCSMETVRVGG